MTPDQPISGEFLISVQVDRPQQCSSTAYYIMSHAPIGRSVGLPGESTPLIPVDSLSTEVDMSPQTETAGLEGGTADDAARIRRIVRKIDWRLIPLLFFTYMLNFMDKTILSSASVFGLIGDTVSLASHFLLFWHDCKLRI